MTVWLVIVGMGVVTFAIRLSMIMLLGHVGVPALVQRALRFVPSAVFSAIILPELLRPAGRLDLSWDNARLLAGALAAVIAWRTRNVLLSIAVGMAALWALTLANGLVKGG